MATPEYPLRISPGTQVVVGSRRTGVVVEVVDGDPVAYRVRYPTGDEVVLGRDQLRIRKQAQQAALGPVRDPAALMGELLDGWVVYRCVTGSQAYGLAEDGSDVDIRGVFVAPAELLWSLQGAPDYFERGETEEAYWELAKFATLALKANPNVLECLHTPLVRDVRPIGAELLELREAFLSRLVHQTYNGYVLSQFKKLEQDLRTRGAPKWKHVMHLIRLLLSGISVLAKESSRSTSAGTGTGSWPSNGVRSPGTRWKPGASPSTPSSTPRCATAPSPSYPTTSASTRFVIDVRRRIAHGERP